MTIYAFSSITAFAISFLLSLFVCLKGIQDKNRKAIIPIILCAGTWCLFPYLSLIGWPDKSLFFTRLVYIAAIFTAPSFLNFGLTILDIEKEPTQKKIIKWSLLISIFLFLPFLFSPFFINDIRKVDSYFSIKGGPLYIIFFLYFGIVCLYCFYKLYLTIKESSGSKKNQLKYIFIGFLLAFISGLIHFTTSLGFPELFPHDFLVIACMILLIYSILRHHLMDIRVALTRAGIFIAVYTLVLGIPFALALWGKAWLMAVLGYYWWMSPLVLLGSLAVAGPYLYIYIDRRAEEKLFRDLKAEQAILKNYKKDLEGAAKTMILVHDPGMLIKMIVRTIVQKAKVTHAGILLYDKDKDTYSLTVSRGAAGVKIPAGFLRLDANNPLIRLFRERKNKGILEEGALIYEEAKKSLKDIKPDERKLLEDALYQMEMLETNICIPSYFRDDLLGMLLLGRKEGGALFKRGELELFIALASDVAMAIRNAQLFKELEVELSKKQRLFIHTTIALAAAIDAKDHYTHGHTARVTALSLELAKKLSAQNKKMLDEKFLESLHIAGLLHDIGKIGISESILNKDGPLDEKETQIMQSHPLVGATILQPIKELEDAIIGVKYHHERYDGSGYPDGLKEDQIPLIASIISVADTFDAMITDRPYRRGLSKEEAIKEIQSMIGKQFNPWIASAFVELYQERKI